MYIHVTFIKKWDICAGNALFTALGGHMTTLKGKEMDYSGAACNTGSLLASVKVDHQALVEKLPAWDSADKHTHIDIYTHSHMCIHMHTDDQGQTDKMTTSLEDQTNPDERTAQSGTRQ
ncbi:hypothetical protein J4Q44_G00269010 [Coregonus suidteri]|uniref:inositol-phosphate phosphatase n=1 Tax=Coregonus suidteri TaxID=861788 RepID=A0AAN8LBZ1_9TELE